MYFACPSRSFVLNNILHIHVGGDTLEAGTDTVGAYGSLTRGCDIGPGAAL